MEEFSFVKFDNEQPQEPYWAAHEDNVGLESSADSSTETEDEVEESFCNNIRQSELRMSICQSFTVPYLGIYMWHCFSVFIII